MSMLLEEDQKRLQEQQLRDERDEAVENVIEECLDCFWLAGGGIGENLGEDREKLTELLKESWDGWKQPFRSDWARTELVEDALPNACLSYWPADLNPTIDAESEDMMRGVLLTAANLWGVGRV